MKFFGVKDKGRMRAVFVSCLYLAERVKHTKILAHFRVFLFKSDVYLEWRRGVGGQDDETKAISSEKQNRTFKISCGDGWNIYM